MAARALMLQGTASDVGKSVLVAALCRLARRRGLSVAPFKPQNMSNNASACPGGGEIGRAQALQARAAGLEPNVHMNPVLLKPETDRRAQVVVQGRALSSMEASDYMNRGRALLLDKVLESFHTLCEQHDLVIVEGAGSPAEVNLREGDIANMGFACAANVPVVLIGDIDRGGVIASLVGTQNVLTEQDAAMIHAFLINRFRGDPRLFDDGVVVIETMTGWPCLGVVPWIPACASLPAEDAVTVTSRESALPTNTDQARTVIVAPMFSRLANFDDADPLINESGVDFRWIPPGQALPSDADVVILFGTKSTTGEIDFMEHQGWHHDIIAHARRGGHVMGLCGGYQMLGHVIHDPDGHDGPGGKRAGLGLLDITTHMHAHKQVTETIGRCAHSDVRITGYEIHSGTTTGPDTQRPLFFCQTSSAIPEPDGACSANGRVTGSYLHGIFANDAWRRDWLERVGAVADPDYIAESAVESAIDALADAFAADVNVDALLALATPPLRKMS